MQVPDPAPARALVWAGIACAALVSAGAPGPAPTVSVARAAAGGCVLVAGNAPESAGACSCADWPGRLRLLFGGRVPLTAPVHDLQAVPGIGPVRARAIVAERERGGRFANLEALTRVRGIGAVTVERVRPWLDSRGACAAQGS